MPDFGYKIQKDRQIDYDNNDRTFFYYLKRVEPTISLCIGCGTCTATCSANRLTDFNFRKVMQFIRRGEKGEFIKEIDKCMLCGKCILVCPKNINTRNVIHVARQYFYSPLK
jgi:heterodisulfide reductase subunit C